MIAVAIWQSLLNGLGWFMAQVYDLVPNYALTIIIVTAIIRILLLPFGFKQIKSMQHMQAIQPKIKELQRRYKNDKAKQQEETMKLYREAGVNPLGGCLPMLLTLPFLFAMYAVIRPPQLVATTDPQSQAAYEVHNNHLPTDSTLFYDVIMHENLDALSLNLQCSLAQSGTHVVLKDTSGQPLVPGRPILSGSGQLITGFDPPPTSQSTLNCGTKKFPDAIPYIVLLLGMLGTAIYQQRQMSKASPPSAQTGTQAAMMKYMPLLYGVWGWAFPAGLIVYWTTANGIQIAQQTLMLRAGHIGPEALERRMAEQRARAESGKGQRKGIMGWMNEKAAAAQGQQSDSRKQQPPSSNPRSKPKPGGGSGGSRGSSNSKKSTAKGGPGSSNSKRSSSKGGSSGGGNKGRTPPPKGGAKPGNQLKPKKPEGTTG